MTAKEYLSQAYRLDQRIDSSVLGIDETVSYIEEFVRKKLKL